MNFSVTCFTVNVLFLIDENRPKRLKTVKTPDSFYSGLITSNKKCHASLYIRYNSDAATITKPNQGGEDLLICPNEIHFNNIIKLNRLFGVIAVSEFENVWLPFILM